MEKIYICDFEDSFTYNLFSEITTLRSGTQVEIIKLEDIERFLESLKLIDHKAVVILGPGPGQPKEYEKYVLGLKHVLCKKNILFLGVCLGHQILWSLEGILTQKGALPIHGQAQTYKLSPLEQAELTGFTSEIKVQKYNSLVVKLTFDEQVSFRALGWLLVMDEDEIVISKKDNILTYQFHPESIGTTNRAIFFEPIFKFLGVMS